jgi:hypothetical protein
VKKRANTEINKLKDKADRALQDWFRQYCWNRGIVCINCGSKTELAHHFYEKSRSAGLRYEEKNLIPICRRCHTLHHRFGDPSIAASIMISRGREWYDDLTEMKNNVKGRGIDKVYLEEQLDKWKKKLEQEKPIPDDSVL